MQVRYNSVRVRATGLPNSAATRLAAGTPVNVPVQVTNTGTLPLTFFADPRLNTQGTLSLDELTGNATVPLPMPALLTVRMNGYDPTMEIGAKSSAEYRSLG